MLCMWGISVSMTKNIWRDAACDGVGFSSFAKSCNKTRSHHIADISDHEAIIWKMCKLYRVDSMENSWRKSLFKAVMQEENTYTPSTPFTGVIQFPNVTGIPFVTFALFQTLLTPSSSLSVFKAGGYVLKWNACNHKLLKFSYGHHCVFYCGWLNKECETLLYQIPWTEVASIWRLLVCVRSRRRKKLKINSLYDRYCNEVCYSALQWCGFW